MLVEIIVGTLLSAFSAWITHLVNVSKTRQEIRKIRSAYNLPAKIPFNDFRNTIMLVGIGGVGKTSLIQAITECETANPKERTKDFKIYCQRIGNSANRENIAAHSNGISHSPDIWYYICDYCGQNIGSLIRAFIEQQKREYSPIAFGYVNSLILMVDLYPPPARGNSFECGIYEPDEQRILANKREWNKTAIDAVFGMLTKELTYVCLFINKIDLMKGTSKVSKEAYIDRFNDIIDTLKERQLTNDFELDIVVGSTCGEGLPRLKRKLKEHSVNSVSNERRVTINV